jgi:two-component system OmpR family sensor kinase
LAVRNEGRGLKSEDREGLFEPFHRGRNPASGEYGGWGLGLSLVRGIVDAHGGKIEVESTPGDGATFKVYIPKDARPYQLGEQTLVSVSGSL